jgi:hypothetical protein
MHGPRIGAMASEAALLLKASMTKAGRAGLLRRRGRGGPAEAEAAGAAGAGGPKEAPLPADCQSGSPYAVRDAEVRASGPGRGGETAR